MLSAWSKGNRDDVLKMLMGESIETNIYMEEGKRIHEIVSENKLPLIPLVKKTAIFEDINPEKGLWKNYFKCPVNEWCDLSMVADVYDPVEKIVIDWKTGSRSSTEHNKLQVYLYAYGLSKLPVPINIEWGIIAHIVESPDKTIFCTDYTVYKMNQEKLDIAENYIETVGGEIYNMINDMKNGN